MWKIWLIISGFFLILEIFTIGFLVFWFSISALLTMILSLFVHNTIIQITFFIISSTILLFATRPFVNKVCKKDLNFKTNAYSVEGKKGIVLQEINSQNSSGQVKVNGEIWSAKTEDNSIIEENSNIIVEKIDGVKLIVKKIN